MSIDERVVLVQRYMNGLKPQCVSSFLSSSFFTHINEDSAVVTIDRLLPARTRIIRAVRNL